MYDPYMLVAWEAQVHEPLFVEQVSGLLQQLNAAAVVLDGVIILTKDIYGSILVP